VIVVTGRRFDARVFDPLMFWKSACQGGTDTTAKLERAAAKWLFPQVEILAEQYKNGRARA
jgi:hypothetical protein